MWCAKSRLSTTGDGAWAVSSSSDNALHSAGRRIMTSENRKPIVPSH